MIFRYPTRCRDVALLHHINFAGLKEWEHLSPCLEIGSETLPLQLFYPLEESAKQRVRVYGSAEPHEPPDYLIL